ncbi:MAG: IscS subfamily cysteine desulfurase [Oscillospiraceae bacterium]|nr:IscS subfamily cysteine desulfurase [Oscillospiraceae bacterium]
MKTTDIIYLDNAATTRLSPAVLDAMLPYLNDCYGNPSSLYSLGRQSQTAITKAREEIAQSLNCDKREIYFTGGGSESNNWAIKTAAAILAESGTLAKKHIISSEFEHHAALHVLETLQKTGFEVTLLPVYKDGRVRVADLEKALRPDTGLVTIMHANNEIGTIQPIAEIGAVCHERGVWLHTDAAQSVGKIPVDIAALNVDFLTISGHKIHAAKGVGALYINKRIKFGSLIQGGGQERGLRAGTENVAGIVGLGVAVREAVDGLEAVTERLLTLRQKLCDGIVKIEKSHLNGSLQNRLPSNLNFSFEGIEGEALLLHLDLAGICCSSGSACTSGSLDPSHVLLALGLPHEIAHGSLRITTSKYTTDAEIDRFLEVLPGVVGRLREMSPLWNK